MPVKGLAEPGRGLRAGRGVGPVRSRLQAAAGAGAHAASWAATPSWTSSASALEQAGAGQGQIVALVGEPGVGKSRLVWEFTHSHRIAGLARPRERGSVSYGKATPYLPVIDLLQGYFQIDERDDDPRRIREKVTGQAARRSTRPCEPPLPAFLALLDVPVGRRRRGRRSIRPSAASARSTRVKRLLLRESQVQPLLLVFEDLHWIDSETQALARQPGREPAHGARSCCS